MGFISCEVMLYGGCKAGATVNVYGGVPFVGVTEISVHCNMDLELARWVTMSYKNSLDQSSQTERTDRWKPALTRPTGFRVEGM